MQTNLANFIKDTAEGRQANSILRSCVHCGFCNATCPTYQLLGNELDGPRGRIYLIKQLLEGKEVSGKTQQHLDRCLTCRNCETTCPSGVKYGELLKIGRALTDKKVPRSLVSQSLRTLLLLVLPYEKRFSPLLKIGQYFRPLLPPPLKKKVPARQIVTAFSAKTHGRKVILLRGCAQPGLKPNTNQVAKKLLDHLGIEALEANGSGCCGAVHEHLGEETHAQNLMKANIDAWWPLIESGAESIIMTASGCGAVVKDYGKLLVADQQYAIKAQIIADKTLDISEFLAAEPISFIPHTKTTDIAWHAPCTLQHHQKITGIVESLLEGAGYHLVIVPDPHLCCGSAGTYSILQPKLSQQLKEKKLDALTKNNPELIVTANIGCQVHLESGTELPVMHWIELIEQRIQTH